MAGGKGEGGKGGRWLKGLALTVLALGLAIFIATHIDTPAPYVE